ENLIKIVPRFNIGTQVKLIEKFDDLNCNTIYQIESFRNDLYQIVKVDATTSIKVRMDNVSESQLQLMENTNSKSQDLLLPKYQIGTRVWHGVGNYRKFLVVGYDRVNKTYSLILCK